MVFNASDPIIATALLSYGFNAERLQQGATLYAETIEMVGYKQMKNTNQYSTTSAYATALKLLKKSFGDHVRIARIAFKDNIEGQRLLPLLSKLTNYDEFKSKATSFYNIILESEQLGSAMGSYGMTRARLSAMLDSLASLEELNQKKFIETSEACSATEARNRKIGQLSDYCSALKTIARIALTDQPQQLEKMGIVVRKRRSRKAMEGSDGTRKGNTEIYSEKI